MRRLTLVLLAATAGFLALGGPVAAQPDANLNREVTGPFSGTESFEFGAGCSFLHQVYDAMYQPDTPSPGSIHIDVCVRFMDTNVFPVNGTFQLTTRTGATLTGTVVGTLILPSVGAPADLDFTLAVAEGTSLFKHATGTIVLDGVWNLSSAPGNAISGTLSGSLQR